VRGQPRVALSRGSGRGNARLRYRPRRGSTAYDPRDPGRRTRASAGTDVERFGQAASSKLLISPTPPAPLRHRRLQRTDDFDCTRRGDVTISRLRTHGNPAASPPPNDSASSPSPTR